ncbi:MAG: hypothetical protein AAGL96_16145 [Pseudomonadota bacterium]
MTRNPQRGSQGADTLPAPDPMPFKDRVARLQILGSPDRNWSLTVDTETLEQFLRASLARLDWPAPATDTDATRIAFDYDYHVAGGLCASSGSLQLVPEVSLSFDALPFGLAHHLLAFLHVSSPLNENMVIVIDDFRALFYRPLLRRDDGILRLNHAFDVDLTRVIFPPTASAVD